ncbi:transglutaminase-like domain-containing protein [Bifidobacterium scardovii]|uniref:Transglutaminase n=1 Tax=Bifidobacterium scardovii TaxID=158787 RepID=A0A087D9G0_9BIFI|nr:transglutaminase family protein [Bifidobacterium scardovii]KFI92160.1 transglutaminase [Bifidobacterium scardovii]MDK6350597.1 transglutaminase family protein [Bifidobacterium scardovii]MDU8982604.1 transglutaminase family protein [Bifidobacterium scardovii]BAQ31809.1 hypothetical protein BBSC_1729 [Bifidobacterium scardovii JCM 12489 = DSM 13734]
MTVLRQLESSLDTYLEENPYVDYSDASIRELSATLSADATDLLAYMQRAFEYVRDEVPHSWDIQSRRVTVTATECLRYRTGICYAKSNLLAALLRVRHIPTGFCYQRLMLGTTPGSGYCIHALNAIHWKDAWHRLDARGNKPGVDARFDLDVERLAFPVHPEQDEIDYPEIYAQPLSVCMSTLENSVDAIDMYLHHLPERL